MTSKLTLSVNSRTISKAKKYAKKQGISVSKIFENHIESLTGSESGHNVDPLVSLKRLRGIAKNAIPEDVNYKDLIADILAEKYK
jgi:hypothetical protein